MKRMMTLILGAPLLSTLFALPSCKKGEKGSQGVMGATGVTGVTGATGTTGPSAGVYTVANATGVAGHINANQKLS